MEKENPTVAGGASDVIGRTWNDADYIKAPADHQAIRYLIHRFGVQMFAPKGGDHG